jgi:hypothetical protein
MFRDHCGDFDIFGPQARDHHELAVPAGDDARMCIPEFVEEIGRLVNPMGRSVDKSNEFGKGASAKPHERLLSFGHAARLPLQF